MNKQRILCRVTTHVIYQIANDQPKCYCYYSSNKTDHKGLIGSLLHNRVYKKSIEGFSITSILENPENKSIIRHLKVLTKSDIFFLQELQNVYSDSKNLESVLDILIDFFVDYGYKFEPYKPYYMINKIYSPEMSQYFCYVNSQINRRRHYEKEEELQATQ